MLKDEIKKLEEIAAKQVLDNIPNGSDFAQGYDRGQHWGKKHLAEDALKIIRKLEAALEEIQWRPIETAPKEDTIDNPILLLTEERQIIEGYWTERGSEWISIIYPTGEYEKIIQNLYPTHWMPLPKPPALEETKKILEGETNE